MSYQVLARKWRPRTFSQMVGQEHVVRALTNALESDRLHHAYLFTGTRGVGKTTLARIFAKSLNCVEGVGAHPCGVCAVCREVDEGRFADLLEVDAASRTGVDQTRELLENVPYAPAHGRYKVYLIDEVHMFSGGSFNALLKTLEEPPPHVKFLLATTDPQKVPVTVLSRCLQFNLKRMPLEQIEGHLHYLLGEEQIAADSPALRLLSRAADGSMRDALSLLDQAIAFGGGTVREVDVRAMLGSIKGEQIGELASALASGDGARLLAQVATLAEQSPDFRGVLQELLYLFHRIALYQAVPATLEPGGDEAAQIRELASRLTPEDVQLYYQIGLIGKRDLPLAPTPRSGFEMVLLRMLTFRPTPTSPSSGAPVAPPPRPTATPAAAPAPAPAATPATAPAAAPPGSSQIAEESPAAAPALPQDPASWRALIERLRLGGVTRQLANNCLFHALEGGRLILRLDPAHANLNTEQTRERLHEALAKHFATELRLELTVGASEQSQTPAQLENLEQQQRQQRAEQAIAHDPIIQALEQGFEARLVAGSVRPPSAPDRTRPTSTDMQPTLPATAAVIPTQ